MTSGREMASQPSVATSGVCDQPADEDEDDDVEPLLRRVEAARAVPVGGGREVDLRPRPGRDDERFLAERVGDDGEAGEVADAVAGDSGAALPARDEEARVLTMVLLRWIIRDEQTGDEKEAWRRCGGEPIECRWQIVKALGDMLALV